MPRAYSKALASTMVDAAAAGVDAATTISLRLPVLFAHPSMSTATEWNRAWTEKMAAAATGSVAAGLTFGSLAMRWAIGSVSAEQMPHEMLKVGEAATGPAYKAVKANARRLTRAQR